MLVDDAALEALEARLDEPESGRSDYWDQNIQTFEIVSSGRFEGASSLGNVSRKTNLFFSLAHWILQWPYRRMGRRFSAFR